MLMRFITSVTLSLEPQHSLSPTHVSYVDDRSSPLVRTCTTSLPTTTGQYFYHFSYYYCCYYWIVQILPILAPWSSFMGVLGVSILTPMLLSTQPCNQLIPPIAQYQLLLKSHTRTSHTLFGHLGCLTISASVDLVTMSKPRQPVQMSISLESKAISVFSMCVGKGRCNKPPNA